MGVYCILISTTLCDKLSNTSIMKKIPLDKITVLVNTKNIYIYIPTSGPKNAKMRFYAN